MPSLMALQVAQAKESVLSCGNDLPLPPRPSKCTRLSKNATPATLLFPRRKAKLNSNLLPSLLPKLNENQLALEAAIVELTQRVEKRAGSEIAENVHCALEAIDRNEEFINLTLAVFDGSSV